MENTIVNSPKVPRAKFRRSDRLFCFIRICKFGNFMNPFAKITSLPALYFRFGFIRWQKVISMNCGSNTSSWKLWRWVRLDLILSMRNIYISSYLNPFTKCTSSSRSTEFKDLPWNISQMITKIVPISMRIFISNAIKWDIPLLVWWKVNANWDNNMIRISHWREPHCRTNTNIRRKK